MGLSIDNIRFLTLTQRKADLEYNISIDSMEKMALAREQSELTSQYYSKLKSKNIAYYANGQYNKMSYGYLMGYTCNTLNMMYRNQGMLKTDNSMILTDSSGLVILGSSYVSTMTKVLGSSCMDSRGKGGTFSVDKIPELIASIAGEPFTAEDILKVKNGGKIESSYSADILKTLTLENNGKTTHENTDTVTEMYQKLIDFYYPIFQAAAANGWTAEYNQEMETNDDYINDALVSGTFQLAQVNDQGGYDPDTSLTYFIMHGLVLEKTDASVREEITASYNAEKERISEKETWIDIELRDLSTELEATNTEMETLKSQIKDDDMKPFEWCT